MKKTLLKVIGFIFLLLLVAGVAEERIGAQSSETGMDFRTWCSAQTGETKVVEPSCESGWIAIGGGTEFECCLKDESAEGEGGEGVATQSATQSATESAAVSPAPDPTATAAATPVATESAEQQATAEKTDEMPVTGDGDMLVVAMGLGLMAVGMGVWKMWSRIIPV